MSNWVDVADISDYLGVDAPAEDDAEGQQRLANAATSASELLYALSGRKFPGILSTVVRPVPYLAQVGTSRRVPLPQSSWGVCWGGAHTRCESPTFIGLGRSPLIEITEVIIDGEVFDSINYRIDDAKWLVRTDCCPWPMCGCSCDYFTIDFKWGEEPPQLGADAALILAAEMYRAMTPGMTCKLPARLTSIQRQGLTMAVIDPMDFMEKGLTGIYQVDMFLQAYNPGKQIRKPTVFSPDVINTGRRQTWP
jgi:hypothetical protein